MEKLPYPAHLKPISEMIEQGETFSTLRLRCPCGCRKFYFGRAAYTPEEHAALREHEELCRAATDGYRIKTKVDKQGKQITLRKQGLFGHWEAVEVPPVPECYYVTAVRAVCAECGGAHLIFDNRLHGFETACGFPVPPLDCKPLWEVVDPEDAPQGCQVEVSYSAPRYLFERDNPGIDYDNAFDRIDICSRNAQGHLKTILCAYA